MVLFWSAFAIFLTIVISGSLTLVWRWKSRHLDVFAAFGAGVLLAAAFVHMIPEAVHKIGEHAGIWCLGGFLLIYFLEDLVMTHPCGEEHCPNHKIGWSALGGLSVHSVISGLALGWGLRGSEEGLLNVAMLLAIAIHKVPETLALMALLLSAAWSKAASTLALFAFALMAPVGIFLASYNFISGLSHDYLGAALGLSAGTFLFIASSDLLPALHRKDSHRWLNLAAFLAGLLLLSVH